MAKAVLHHHGCTYRYRHPLDCAQTVLRPGTLSTVMISRSHWASGYCIKLSRILDMALLLFIFPVVLSCFSLTSLHSDERPWLQALFSPSLLIGSCLGLTDCGAIPTDSQRVLKKKMTIRSNCSVVEAGESALVSPCVSSASDQGAGMHVELLIKVWSCPECF